MRVIIVGAGIGGLTLAQALRDRCDVTVVERDGGPLETGGYRLAITPPATSVLRRVLPPELLARVRAVSDGTNRFAQFTVATPGLRPLIVGAEDPTADRLLAQRRALRLLLTDGLEGRIRWSTAVDRVSQDASAARVHLAGGSTMSADLVVGAEGALSPTVRSLVGAPTSDDLGLLGIAGSTPRRRSRPVPRFLLGGPALVFGAGGVGLFLSLTSSGSGPLDDRLREAVGAPSIVWGLIAPTALVPDARALTPDGLIEATADLLARWHPWISDTVRASVHDRVAAFAFRAADPARDLTPWTPRRVTALGDAVHAMPPTGGQAASTAILDAGSLSHHVGRHLDGRVPLSDALASYHADLPGWAVPALRESLGPVRALRVLRTRPARALSRPALALAEFAARLRP